MLHLRVSGIGYGFVAITHSALLVLVCTAFLWLSACGKEQQAAMPPPVVEIAEVLQKDVPIVREWVGTTDGLVNATILAQVTGYLISQDYKEGEPVKKGKMLFEIDPRPFEAGLDQAKGNLSRMEALYINAHANFLRHQPLLDSGAISKETFDSYLAADKSAEGQVLAAKAALEKAQLDLGFTKITSPIDGVAGIAKAQVGDLVGPAGQSRELTTVSTIDPIKVKFSISEQDYINWMKRLPVTSPASVLEQAEKMQAELISQDGSVYPHKGRFYAMDRQVDVRTGTLGVQALFPNPNYLLRPGQFVRVRVLIDTKKGALLVPQRAVTELQGTFEVAVVDTGNKVDIRTVKLGERYGSLWEIEEGLKPGERVLAEGVQKVKQGMLVNPKPFAPSSPVAVPKATTKPEHLPATEGR
ncbi:MAG TPA: efflux RND transporter periplasmic adaptor subunit [Geobacteraceae bacterium]|nr:efflux RND transporter periplasmic adaptor subunit [Geobacteraceae bacterium]HVN78414.1 efflux RND transporter periplasmic adaptor subunit [Terriglobia bacterium]